MAKLKKTAHPSTAKPASKPARKASARKPSNSKPSSSKTASSKTGASKLQAAFNPKSITESAQQIWLAGMGAFTRAQSEGGKLFETLVRDGLSLEQTARKFAGSRAGVMRDAMEGRVDQARERAADTWDKLEKVFEDRVQRALIKLGVPGRDDLHALTQRVERLTAELRKSSASKPARSSTPAKAAKATKPAKASKPAKAAKPVKPAMKPVTKPTKAPRKAAAKPASKPVVAAEVQAPADAS